MLYTRLLDTLSASKFSIPVVVSSLSLSCKIISNFYSTVRSSYFFFQSCTRPCNRTLDSYEDDQSDLFTWAQERYRGANPSLPLANLFPTFSCRYAPVVARYFFPSLFLWTGSRGGGSTRQASSRNEERLPLQKIRRNARLEIAFLDQYRKSSFVCIVAHRFFSGFYVIFFNNINGVKL